MIPILTSDSYRSQSTTVFDLDGGAAQPVFIGRIVWPGQTTASDAVIKLYQTKTCGIANEVIGYIANAIRGIAQPANAAVLLLPLDALKGIAVPPVDFVDTASGYVMCWATSLEQNTKPFKFIRRLSTFSDRQAKAFYKSKFCKRLSSIDHVTGNNDRHDGNFLYVDDLNYMAIDQGCVGGSLQWHLTWPDSNPKNEIIECTRNGLDKSDWASWVADALLEHMKTQNDWAEIEDKLLQNLAGLLDADLTETIVDYMRDRASGPTFTAKCGLLI
jgi:hypothetical protein